MYDVRTLLFRPGSTVAVESGLTEAIKKKVGQHTEICGFRSDVGPLNRIILIGIAATPTAGTTHEDLWGSIDANLLHLVSREVMVPLNPQPTISNISTCTFLIADWNVPQRQIKGFQNILNELLNDALCGTRSIWALESCQGSVKRFRVILQQIKKEQPLIIEQEPVRGLFDRLDALATCGETGIFIPLAI